MYVEHESPFVRHGRTSVHFRWTEFCRFFLFPRISKEANDRRLITGYTNSKHKANEWMMRAAFTFNARK